MMVSVAVTGHGGRGAGTSNGTYVVPAGVTVYFFTKDKQLLNADGSDLLMDTLCNNHSNELAVQGVATEVKGEYEKIPNYICYGTNDFRDPSGVYGVGTAISTGMVMAIPNGTQKRLSDIIGGSGKGKIGNRVYWLCCRDAPLASNNPSISQATSLTDSSGNAHVLGGNQSPSDMGLKPSTVKTLGTWI